MTRYLKDKETKAGLISSIPIILGYTPVAITFGIMAKGADISLLESILISMVVYAGASQFLALNLMAAGTGMIEIIFATFLINFRFFLMSTVFVNRLKEDLGKWNIIIGQTLTDETFSVASFRKEDVTKNFIITLNLLSYSSWVLGTILGYYSGSILPEILTESMGMALYAMFIAILIPEIKRSRRIGFLIFLSAFINTLLMNVKSLPQGWNMILAILISSSIGATIFKDEVQKENKE
ncbi:branched-chain amino acid permease protein/azaleucin resistance protein [Gottschalkia acidurici 9a]|uniref:Branched-chain amino acid permease protein/azaleucin resistance protein n=1 Tax=Gottschalkia acidurici (strain ATCC 7906 / DSM 604 / BCRC 14475 / CIP 104303 / KCTC 5404 / NCIMB 10678 / 9a) TaxID=1128398 RepID=K0B4N9_GOTA9|nr:AzlC family ABC transporter permease [Gottschalkia acidurici]AFS79531.1 branched-chain amino acid permease protein/azaleucin resistance protein [Gottschalkia acidurici 9a]